MGDSLIVRRGGSGSSSRGTLKTVILTENTTWTVPKAKDQMFMVRIFGGGQAGGGQRNDTFSARNQSAGCGGMMNNAILMLNQGLNIPITIGAGGIGVKSTDLGASGKTTFFGNYLSAYGGGQLKYGAGGSGGGYTSHFHSSRYGSEGLLGVGLQFGGGGAFGSNIWRSYGGYWGGGGGMTLPYNSNSYEYNLYANQYKRGGCIFQADDGDKEQTMSDSSVIDYSGLGGNGGFGSGNRSKDAANGTNTMSYKELFDMYEYKGKGLKGNTSSISVTLTYSGSGTNSVANINNVAGGGGGYGGNGGNNIGGGGGYGGNGGNNIGGGGGYGADGGDGCFYGVISEYRHSSRGNLFTYTHGGGGGGGYGPSGKGGNAERCSNLTANAAGYSNANNSTFDVIPAEDGGFAAGGGSFGNRTNAQPSNGGNGICIISYYE